MRTPRWTRHLPAAERWDGQLLALACVVGLSAACDPTGGAAAPDDLARASATPSASTVGGPEIAVVLLTEQEQTTSGTVVEMQVKAEPDILEFGPESKKTGFMKAVADGTTLLATQAEGTLAAVQYTWQAKCKAAGTTKAVFVYKRSNNVSERHETGVITCGATAGDADTSDTDTSDTGTSDTGTSDTGTSGGGPEAWGGKAKLSGVSTTHGKPVVLASGCLQSPGTDILVTVDGQKPPESGKKLNLRVGVVFEKGYPLCNVFVGAKLSPPGFTGGARIFVTPTELRLGQATSVPIEGLKLPAVVLVEAEVNMATQKLSARVTDGDQKTLAEGESTLPADVFTDAQSGDDVGALFIDADLCQLEAQ